MLGGVEVATYAGDSTESGTVATCVWRRIWYGRLCHESCHRRNKLPGDLFVGDWWGLEHCRPGLEDVWGVSCVIGGTSRGLPLLRGALDSLEMTEASVDDVANPARPMLMHPPERRRRSSFRSELYARGFEFVCHSVGALGLARAVKNFVRRAISLGKGGPAEGTGEAVANRTWKEVPMVDFDELKVRNEYPVAFAARNRDNDVRRASSSGGVYHALASHVINGLGGVVYGCAFDGRLRAVHVRCETMAEAERCMGSKYSQSDMGGSIRRVRDDLKAGRTVLFTGTPCQVAAVRSACADVREGLVTAEMICHGVPSPGVFQEWLAELERARGTHVASYEHRPKSMGWGHCERISWEGGRTEQGTRLSETWERLFYGNGMLRPSCYFCPYTTTEGRPGDVTIADFWGVEVTPHARGDDSELGVSFVLANSPTGLRVLSKLDIDLEVAALAEALPRNPMLERPSSCGGDRSIPWRELYAGGMLSMAKGQRYLVSPARFFALRAKRALKRILGR